MKLWCVCVSRRDKRLNVSIKANIFFAGSHNIINTMSSSKTNDQTLEEEEEEEYRYYFTRFMYDKHTHSRRFKIHFSGGWILLEVKLFYMPSTLSTLVKWAFRTPAWIVQQDRVEFRLKSCIHFFWQLIDN